MLEKAEQYEALAEQHRDAARKLREGAGGKTSLLPSAPKQRSISVDMSLPNSTATGIVRNRRGRPLKTDARFPRALEARGSNIDEWTAKHPPLNPKTVRSWYQIKGGRRIPVAYAKIIESEMGTDGKGRPTVPATLESWPNGIAN